ncbi:MAG: DUF4336 domain-containing protein [Myxococcota bacterium]
MGDIGARMTVIRLSDRMLMLHSPVELDAALKSALDGLGSVRWILGPSKAHHLFLLAYVKSFPEASLCGAAGLAEKRQDLRFQHVLSDTAPDGWPGEVSFHFVGGAPFMNEVAFLHRPSRTLVLTDLVFNVGPKPRTGRGSSIGWSAPRGVSALIGSFGSGFETAPRRAGQSIGSSHGTSIASSCPTERSRRRAGADCSSKLLVLARALISTPRSARG